MESRRIVIPERRYEGGVMGKAEKEDEKSRIGYNGEETLLKGCKARDWEIESFKRQKELIGDRNVEVSRNDKDLYACEIPVFSGRSLKNNPLCDGISNMINNNEEESIPVYNDLFILDSASLKQKFESIRSGMTKEYNRKLNLYKEEYEALVLMTKNTFKESIRKIDNLEAFILSEFPPCNLEKNKKEINNLEALFINEFPQEIIYEKQNIITNSNILLSDNMHPKSQESISNKTLCSFSPCKDFTLNYLISKSNSRVTVTRDFKRVSELNLPEKFTKSLKLMALNNKEVLLAYPNSTVYVINVFTNEIWKIQNFKVKRSQFSACYVGEYPAIIAGNLDITNQPDTTVELFLDGEWVMGNKLNIGRSNFYSIKHENSTYVFGGVNTLTIEKYENYWAVLNVNISSQFSNFALCSRKNQIYLFGGKKKLKKSVYVFDTFKENLQACKDLPKGFSDKGGISAKLIDENNFLLFHSGNNFVRYSLKPEQ